MKCSVLIVKDLTGLLKQGSLISKYAIKRAIPGLLFINFWFFKTALLFCNKC